MMSDGHCPDGEALKAGCIYCGLQRPFNDEHIFPAGLGGDDGTFVLRDLVCNVCNSETFSRMEAGLMHNSPEAFARIHLQPTGRKRGKSSRGPKFKPQSTTAFLPEGGDAEAEIRAGGQVVLLPQFSFRENRVDGQGSDVSELQEFASRLDVLLSQDRLALVTKNSGTDRAYYDILAYQWDGICYQEAERSVAFNPPKLCIWRDQRPNDDLRDRPYRIFRRSDGQIVLRAGDKGEESQFLTILRRNRQQVIGAANNAAAGKSITGTPIMVQMNASFIDRERVFAKIGLNFCAFVFGESFVRHPCFDKIKSSILTAATPIESRNHHLQDMDREDPIVRLLSAAPPKHHLCTLTAGALPNGDTAVIFAIRLFEGVLTSVTLTESVPLPTPNTPVFMLVDYVNHKVNVLGLAEYVDKYLIPVHARSS